MNDIVATSCELLDLTHELVKLGMWGLFGESVYLSKPSVDDVEGSGLAVELKLGS